LPTQLLVVCQHALEPVGELLRQQRVGQRRTLVAPDGHPALRVDQDAAALEHADVVFLVVDGPGHRDVGDAARPLVVDGGLQLGEPERSAHRAHRRLQGAQTIFGEHPQAPPRAPGTRGDLQPCRVDLGLLVGDGKRALLPIRQTRCDLRRIAVVFTEISDVSLAGEFLERLVDVEGVAVLQLLPRRVRVGIRPELVGQVVHVAGNREVGENAPLVIFEECRPRWHGSL
jgi:hypothetical protein